MTKIKLFIVTLALLSLSSDHYLLAQTQTAQQKLELKVGQPIEREIAGNQTHTYQVTLSAGDYLHAIVDQRGIDVLIVMFGPDGKQLMEVDSPNGMVGPEPIWMIATTTGSHRLEIRVLNRTAPVGRYQVKIENLRPAAPADKHRVAAQIALMEARHLASNEASEANRRAAIEKLSGALSHWHAVGEQNEEIKTLTFIGTLYLSLTEPQHAINHLNQALPLSRSVGDRNGESIVLSSLGTAYDLAGEVQRAIDHFSQALPLSRAVGNRNMESAILSSLGLAYSSLGQEQRAIDYFNQAHSLSRATSNRNLEALALRSLGVAHLSQGEAQRAIEYFNQALTLHNSAVSNREATGKSITLTHLGSAYRLIGKSQLAIDYHNQALSLSRKIGNRSVEAAALYGLAAAERDLGQLSVALAHAKEGFQLMESVRAKVINPELRASFFKERYYLNLYLNLLMQLHEQRPADGFASAAFQFSEQIRARGLLELLAEARADIRRGADPKLLGRERALREKLNAKAQLHTRLLSSSTPTAKAQEVAQEINVISAELQDLETKIRATSPRYAALTMPTPVTIPEIQRQLLDRETLLLEYTLSKEHSYLWAISSDDFKSFVLPGRAQIESLARDFYDLLTARSKRIPGETTKQRLRRIAQADVQLPEAAARLSEMILGPVADQLGSKRLLIVADGALYYIPFAALPSPIGNKQDMLVTSHEIVNLPSASVLFELRRNATGRSPTPKMLAVLADPVFTRQDARVRAQVQKVKLLTKQETTNLSLTQTTLTRSVRESGLELARLRASRQEAMAAVALIPTNEQRQAFDFEASRTMALNAELSQYRLLHFATHGLLNNVHPELSGLVFSLVDEAGREQDGFVRLHDIYNLNLSADLVVLSACQTALGKEVRGEGLIGLTRGFMYAGASRVMASLWRVDDRATAKLMGEFYRAMLGEEQLTAAAALRKSQLALREKRPQPYYWAGFTLQGEWR